jgi:hypothetical protein
MITENSVLSVIEEYIEEEIDSRVFGRLGGAEYDYANFCTKEDFICLREEIESDFEDIYTNTYENAGFKTEDELHYFSEKYGRIKNCIEENKVKLKYAIKNLEENANTNKIFDYLENEIKYRECKIEVAFNKLINQLIEKKVVKNFEELSQIESYKKAVEHWDFIYKS